LKDSIPVLSKHHNTLTKLHLYNEHSDLSLSFIASFINLQELVISSFYSIYNELQHMIFPNLQVFRIVYLSEYDVDFSDSENFIKFLKNNGKNLTDLCINHYIDKSLNLSIMHYCLNLKNLVIVMVDIILMKKNC